MSKGKVHHVGRHDALEDEMVTWQPEGSSWSPNRVDALVWVLTELLTGGGAIEAACASWDPEPRRSVWDPERPERNISTPWDNPHRPWPSIFERDPGRGIFNY